MAEIKLRCRCGTVTGVAEDVSPETGTHIVCYCDDCRAFLRSLERTDLLDAHGGTEIYQMTPAQVRITAGQNELRCMRLTDGGMYRWYTACCHTPVGNTIAAWMPFVGMPRAMMEAGLAESGRSERSLLGETVHVQGRYAPNGTVRDAHPRAPMSLIARSIRLLARNFVRGRQQPSPYFDRVTKKPPVAPTLLAADELERLKAIDV
jgi:hypothetical protein